MDVKYDPILDKLRERDTGGGGGGGGGDYIAGTGINSVALEGGTVAVANIPQSAVTGLPSALNGKQPTISSGATMDINITGTAAQLGGATKQQVIDSAVASASGGGVVGNVATVSDVMTGVTGGTQTIVDVDSLRGGLTAGQAVDVTSEPDNFPSGDDYRGEFDWSEDTLGFASFPKFVSGLKYLMVADLKCSGSGGSVTPTTGTWLDGTSTAVTLPGNETKRVAILFDTASGCSLSFTFIDPTLDAVAVNMREYEVTACSNDAIAYIAALEDLDSFQDYYLVKRDMVSPWTYIINMGTSPATTVAAGLAYQIDCTFGSHIITVDTCPNGYVGRDTFVRLLVGETGGVVVQSPLKLGTPLVANAINNCEVKYRDGEAVLTVTDTLGGYIVTDISGTTDGTLYYGLTASNASPYVTFSPVTDGQPLNLSGAVISGAKIVVGNGAGSTTLTGGFKPNSQTQMSNLSLADVVVSSGGYMTLGNSVEISSGASLSFDKATVQVNGGTVNGSMLVSRGTLQLSSAVGTGTIDLSSQNVIISSGSSVVVNGPTVTNGSAVASGYAFLVSKGATLVLSSSVISGNNGSTIAAGGAAVCIISGGSMIADHCTFASNFMTSSFPRDIWINQYGHGTLKDSVIKGTIALGSCTIEGSNSFAGALVMGSTGQTGAVMISSGAIIDLTGNTNNIAINPGGTNNITFGANVTIINSAGTSMSLNNGAAGSCTTIKKDGTTT